MPSSPYYPALTGVRAVAAYAVFFMHYNAFAVGSWPWHVADQGGVGVTVFFVLSGFLIARRYADRVALNRTWLLPYFRNRAARIYPLYLLLTLLTFAAVVLRPALDSTGQWAGFHTAEKALVVGLNLTLLRAFFADFVFTGIAPGWTLTVEETFYALAPLLLLGMGATRRPLRLLAGYAAGLLVLGAVLVRVLPHPYGLLSTQAFALSCTFFGQGVVFFVGMGLAWWVAHRPLVPRRWPRTTVFGVLACAGCLLLRVATYTPVAHPTLGIEPWSFAALNLFVLFPLSVAVLFRGLAQEHSWLRKVLASSLFQLLGKSSYAFYLLHMGVFHHLIVRYVSDSTAVAFVLTVAVSIGLHEWVEKPLHHWVKSWGRPKTAPLVAA